MIEEKTIDSIFELGFLADIREMQGNGIPGNGIEMQGNGFSYSESFDFQTIFNA